MFDREDFDFEYENDAELLLADMEFGPDDHPSERELKLQVSRDKEEIRGGRLEIYA